MAKLEIHVVSVIRLIIDQTHLTETMLEKYQVSKSISITEDIHVLILARYPTYAGDLTSFLERLERDGDFLFSLHFPDLDAVLALQRWSVSKLACNPALPIITHLRSLETFHSGRYQG